MTHIYEDSSEYRQTWFSQQPRGQPRQIYKQQLLESPPGTRIVLIHPSVGTVYHATLLRCEETRFCIVYDHFGASADYPDAPFYTDMGLAPDDRGYWNHVNWVEFETPGYVPVVRPLPKKRFVVERLDWREYGF